MLNPGLNAATAADAAIGVNAAVHALPVVVDAADVEEIETDVTADEDAFEVLVVIEAFDVEVAILEDLEDEEEALVVVEVFRVDDLVLDAAP
jgi:hypothetical protein